MLELPRLAKFAAACASIAASSAAQGPAWSALTPVRVASERGTTLEIVDGADVRAVGEAPDNDVYTLEFQIASDGATGLRLDVLVDPSSGGKGPGRSTNGNFVLAEVEIVRTDGKRATPQRIAFAQASFEQSGHGAALAFDGSLQTGWAVHPDTGREHAVVYELGEDLRAGALTITMRFGFGQQHTLQRFRWSATDAPRPVRLRTDDEGWAGMQERINAAIDSGVDYLLDRQGLDGSWDHAIGDYRNGQTALALYALLKSKVPAKHPSVRRALAFLRCRMPDRTYAAGLEALALSACGSGAHEERIAQIGDLLVEWQRGGFAYPHGEPDLSNSQYAALGLWIAAQHGAQIPVDAWRELAEFTLAQQEPGVKGGSAGFRYHAGHAVTGSRTAGAVAILAICDERLPESDPMRKTCAAARERGLAWLAQHFTGAADPLASNQEWVYYWLYGCERVGALTNRTHFGAHDWYREGARFLVDAQSSNGEWVNQPNTCFALLFLNKATARASISGSSAGVRTWGRDSPGRDVSLRGSGDTPLNLWISSFGERVEREYRWPGDPEGALRVLSVEYLLPEQALLADARSGALEWRVAPKPPPESWIEPDFDDKSWRATRGGFGPAPTPAGPTRSAWPSDETFLRASFELDAAELVAPEWSVRFQSSSEAPRAQRDEPLVGLFDESARLIEELHGVEGGSTAALGADAFNGSSALDVTSLQRFRDAVPGWSFEIAKRPAPGQYRYLQFAWRKRDGDGVMLQLARNGRFEGQVFRYFAGRNATGWEAAQIDKTLPERWTVVTRDLYEDLGEGARLTGVAFVSMGGAKASFDALYLARSKNDFAAIEKRGIELERARIARISAPVAGSSPDDELRVWVNGRPSLELSGVDHDYALTASDPALVALLRAGRNVIAVRARVVGGARNFDLGIVDERPVAKIAGSAERAVVRERFAARATLPRSGEFALRARVRVAAPPDAQGRSKPVELFSEPLQVVIREALDPELLAYASDASRNLLLESDLTFTASSELPGWPPMRAADSTLALGWLCGDGDQAPWLRIALSRAVRANTLVFTHPQLERPDPERKGRVQRVSVRFNSQDPVYEIELPRGDARKSTWKAPGPIVVQSLELRVLQRSGVVGRKDGVGFAEVELRNER